MLAELKAPYLLFLGNAPTLGDAKTASGIAYWRRDKCCGQLRLPECKADTGLPDLTIEAARQLGAKSLIIGVAYGASDEPEKTATGQRHRARSVGDLPCAGEGFAEPAAALDGHHTEVLAQ